MILDVPVVDSRWWDRDEPHDAIFANLSWLENHDSGRRGQYLASMRLYGNVDAFGLDLGDTYELRSPNRLTYNVVEAVADTFVSRVGRSRPRATFQTVGGDYQDRAKARQLERYVDMQMYLTGVQSIMPDVLLDSFVFGDGVLYPYAQGTKVCVERVFPGELFVDPADGLYGDPRCIYRSQWIAKDTLLELFPAAADAVHASVASPVGAHASPWERHGLTNMVQVVSAWRRAENGSEGRYAVVCRGGTLRRAEWRHDYLPFVFLRYKNRLRGFWGMGGAEKLMGLQTEINRTLHRIQRALALVAVPRVFLDAGSKVNVQHINNQIGSVLKYTGQKPVFETPQGVSREAVEHLVRLRDWAFEQEGLSPYQATATLPPGLTSGIGQREQGEAQDARSVIRLQRWEEAHVELARRFVNLARDIAEANAGYTVKASVNKFTASEAKWREIDLDADAYVLRAFPTSLLPSTPAGKRSAVIDLLGAGIITDPRRAQRLLDMPDLEDDVSIERAAEDAVDWAAERMINDQEAVSPEPFDDLELCVRRMNAHYLRARSDEVPEERLQLLRDFLNTASELIKRREQAALAMQAGLAGPQGAPPLTSGGGQPATAAVDNVPPPM